MPDVRAFPAVPLVGQPVTVIGWTIVVSVRCNCDRPDTVQLVIKQSSLGLNADLGICPSCGRGMHLANLTLNAQNQLQFGVQIGETSSQPVGASN